MNLKQIEQWFRDNKDMDDTEIEAEISSIIESKIDAELDRRAEEKHQQENDNA
jgi:hypothetical protein